MRASDHDAREAAVFGGAEGEKRLAYAYRPRMVGGATRLTLDTGPQEAVLEWTVGARSGRLPLKDVTRLCLRYEMGQLGAANYALLITSRSGPVLRIGSTSRTSLTGVTDHSAAFVAFVAALHAALATTGTAVSYEAGLPAWRWGAMFALAVITAVALCWLAITALSEGLRTEALLMVGLALVLAWPLVQTLWRNVPGAYSPSSPPTRLLPG